MAIGDLNGDGRPDLAVANQYSNSVGVLRNYGGLSFGLTGTYYSGGSSRSVAIGDLDADGRPDLAVANTDSNTVAVLPGPPPCLEYEYDHQLCRSDSFNLRPVRDLHGNRKCHVGSRIPTGTVTFKDGTIDLGTATLNAFGQAALTTSVLTAGNHSITAIYNGDGTSSSSTSLPVVQMVDAKALTITASTGQDLRPDGDLRRHRFTAAGLVNGDACQRHPDQPRRRRHRSVKGCPTPSPPATPSARAWATTTISYVDGSLTVDRRRPDDHRQRPARPTATTVTFARHRVHRRRPGQRRHRHHVT